MEVQELTQGCALQYLHIAGKKVSPHPEYYSVAGVSFQRPTIGRDYAGITQGLSDIQLARITGLLPKDP